MATISLCMIVRNEQDYLGRCLDSVADLVDEIIIVDTGSTDSTKEIASKYTDQVYDFEWIDDFSAARNFSFSKATMDYIYVPDADEVLDDENREQFRILKEVIDPQVDIVQMKYFTFGDAESFVNVVMEYRPKMFKRLREFTWIDPIHETVRLEPLVFDSDIVINHMPEKLNNTRDFSIFLKMIKENGTLDDRLEHMYATELFKTGDEQDFIDGREFFEREYEISEGLRHQHAAAILLRSYRLTGYNSGFNKIAIKEMALGLQSSDICYELGLYYYAESDYLESFIWFYNAAYETDAVLDVHCGGDDALRAIVDVCEHIDESLVADTTYYDNIARQAKQHLDEWVMPAD